MTRPITADDLWNLARVGGPVATSGGAVVVPVTTYDNDDSLTRLWLIDRDGTRRVLTSTTSATSPAVDGNHVAFVRTVDGRPQLWTMNLTGGEATQLTDWPLGVIAPVWVPGGQTVLGLATVTRDDPSRRGAEDHLEAEAERKSTVRITEDRYYRYWDTWLTDGTCYHLIAVDVATGEMLDLTPEADLRWTMPSVGNPATDIAASPDGSTVAFAAAERLSEPRPAFRIFRVPLDGSAPPEMLTDGNPGDDRNPVFSPDGATLVYGASEELDYYLSPITLRAIDLETGAEQPLTEGWDLQPHTWTFGPTGTLLCTAEQRGRVDLFVIGADGPVELATPNTVHRPAPDEHGVWLQHQSLLAPPSVARLDDDGFRIVADFNTEILDELDLGVVEEISITGADDTPIQTFMVYPPDFDPEKKWPLVHMIHGGPHGVFGDMWHFRWCAPLFAAPGYVVALVNFHGSSSFGHGFAKSIHGEWGDKPATDVLAATDQIVAEGFVDRDRMAITGGSYGGYLAAWLATQSDEFACAIAHAAVTNQGSMWATDHTFGLPRARGAAVWEDPDRVARWSPSHHYAGYVTPTLVIHGEQDYRVPVGQGLELYGVLKAKGVPARLVYYPDENHWILSRANSLVWYDEVHSWLDRWLRE